MENRKKAFSLIELIMVVLIISVFAYGSVFLLSFFLKDTLYTSNQLNTDMIASDAINIMIEGDAKAKGLRFSKWIKSMTTNSVSFVNQDDQDIRYRFIAANQKLQREIDNQGWEDIVPFLDSTINLSANNGIMFTFYDEDDNIMTAAGSSGGGPANPIKHPKAIRRIEISLTAKTGSGDFNKLEGKTDLISSVTVHNYQ